MNPFPSKFKSNDADLSIDTSALINFAATGALVDILRCLNGRAVIEPAVKRELIRNPRDGSDLRPLIESLIKEEHLNEIYMNETESQMFIGLVGALPPDDLGDGEAATLALASTRGAAVIDERKARRIAARDLSHVQLYTTLDILCSPLVVATLTEEKVISAFIDERRFAKMHVPAFWNEWAIEFLGHNAAEAGLKPISIQPPSELNDRPKRMIRFEL
jgi:predicted nucleic acid-binding protein